MRHPFNGSYKVNYGYGYSSNYGGFHEGIDYLTPSGTQLVAAVSGKVIFAGNQPSTAGWAVSILGEGYIAKCFHMFPNSLKVSLGQTVSAGQPIGLSGNTGNSTGPHLHFQVEQQINGKWKAIDPQPLLTGPAPAPKPPEEDMPNAGDVDNAYIQINGRKATEEEKRVYTSKPWSAPDGLYYGKIYVEVTNLQNALKDAQNNSGYEPITEQLYRKK